MKTATNLRTSISRAITALILVLMSLTLLSACSSASAEPSPIVYENKEITLGKYYLDGDSTSEEYIEISDGFGIQYVGFNLYERTYELNKGFIESLSEEERTAVIESMKADAELREAKRYYQISPLNGKLLILKDTSEYIEGLGGETIILVDETTLKFDEDHVYKLVEQ